MIRIEISGDTPAIIRAELQDLLRMYPSDLQEKFGVKVPVTTATEAMSSVTKKMTEMLTAAGVAMPTVVEPGAVVTVGLVAGSDDDALVYHEDPTSPLRVPTLGEQIGSGAVALPPVAEPAKRGRGRPKKTNSDAQPAVANNTGSAPAGNETPPAEGAQESATTGKVNPATAGTVLTDPPAPVVADAQPTNAQMRASLQELCEAAPDMNTGQILAKEILAAFQYQKVGQVQDQHLAGIIEKAKAATARVSEEADKADRGPVFAAITAELVAARQ